MTFNESHPKWLKHTRTHAHTQTRLHARQLSISLHSSVEHFKCGTFSTARSEMLLAPLAFYTAQKYFLSSHHPQVSIFPIVAAIPVKQSFAFMHEHNDWSKMLDCHKVAVRYRHKTNIKWYLSFGLGWCLTHRDVMEGDVNMESVFFYWRDGKSVHPFPRSQTW